VRKFQALPDYPEAQRFFGGGTPPAEATRELLQGHGSADGTGSRDAVEDLRLMFLSCFAKPAGHGTETPWHQDQGLWSIWNPAATSCWVAIDECTPENGCLRFLRGSHREGIVEHVMPEGAFHPYIPAERIDADRIVSVPMLPGDAVFFDGRVLHQSEPNRSGKRRLGVVAVYSPDADLVRSIDVSDWARNRVKQNQPLGSGETFYQERVWIDPPQPSRAWQPAAK
jgi:ectoine hydroxylase-related dioxygenase (phytanoyl-CoA dioxygenase family)